jgi:hypothetical protein
MIGTTCLYFNLMFGIRCKPGMILRPDATCAFCPAGTFQNASDKTKCHPCSAGGYADSPSATACSTDTPAGDTATGSRAQTLEESFLAMPGKGNLRSHESSLALERHSQSQVDVRDQEAKQKISTRTISSQRYNDSRNTTNWIHTHTADGVLRKFDCIFDECEFVFVLYPTGKQSKKLWVPTANRKLSRVQDLYREGGSEGVRDMTFAVFADM